MKLQITQERLAYYCGVDQFGWIKFHHCLLEFIRITEYEWTQLCNNYGKVQTDAMLRLLNLLKSKEDWISHDSDYNNIFGFVHKLFQKEYEKKKAKKMEWISQQKVKYTYDDEALIESMYQEDNGFCWTGCYGVHRDIPFCKGIYMAEMAQKGHYYASGEWRIDKLKSRQQYELSYENN